MLVLRLWNYLCGYVIILVEGYFLEKFINICIHRQIFLWDVKKHKDGFMKLKVSIQGFRMLRPVARKSKCRVRIIDKRGVPFLVNKYRRRKTFVLGAVLFVLSIYIMTSFVWTVEVSGNSKLETQYLTDKLSQLGIKPGILKYRIDTDSTVNNMMIDVKELAWIGITVKGTKVKVEVTERKEPPDLVDKSTPCDIVASRDGVIKQIITKAGYDLVKAGDTVKEGQVLISGKVPNKDEKEPPKLVHATGEVKARTWYEASVPVKDIRTEKVRTGNVKDKYSLSLFTKKLDLWGGNVQFSDYEEVEIKKKLSIGEDIVFPFEFIIDRYYENKTVENEISEDEAKRIAAENALKEASKDIPETAERQKTSTNFIEKENGEIDADVIIECLENIGNTKEIGGN